MSFFRHCSDSCCDMSVSDLVTLELLVSNRLASLNFWAIHWHKMVACLRLWVSLDFTNGSLQVLLSCLPSHQLIGVKKWCWNRVLNPFCDFYSIWILDVTTWSLKKCAFFFHKNCRWIVNVNLIFQVVDFDDWPNSCISQCKLLQPIPLLSTTSWTSKADLFSCANKMSMMKCSGVYHPAILHSDCHEVYAAFT